MSTSLGLSTAQTGYARGIIAACKARRLPADQGPRVADIAIATALTESGLKMYANRNNPRSLQLPHDAVGSDHGSVGLFQQQVGGAVNSTANWGTTDELMNAEVSTKKFLDALLGTNWIPKTNWAAAQSVQRSAFSDGRNYRAQDARAIQIRQALWGGGTPSPSPAPVPPQPRPATGVVHVVVPGDTLFAIAKGWGVTLAALTAANPGAGHPAGNFDVIRPGDEIRHP